MIMHKNMFYRKKNLKYIVHLRFLQLSVDSIPIAYIYSIVPVHSLFSQSEIVYQMFV